MYNIKPIEKFYEKIKQEATIEAQKVFDKYENAFIEKIKNQLKDNDVLSYGMGQYSFDDKEKEKRFFIKGYKFLNSLNEMIEKITIYCDLTNNNIKK